MIRIFDYASFSLKKLKYLNKSGRLIGFFQR